MLATSMQRDRYCVCARTRVTVHTPSSSGWRSASSAVREYSGSSSRNNTPLCAREISPGMALAPPPTSEGMEAE